MSPHHPKPRRYVGRGEPPDFGGDSPDNQCFPSVGSPARFPNPGEMARLHNAQPDRCLQTRFVIALSAFSNSVIVLSGAPLLRSSRS